MTTTPSTPAAKLLLNSTLLKCGWRRHPASLHASKTRKKPHVREGIQVCACPESIWPSSIVLRESMATTRIPTCGRIPPSGQGCAPPAWVHHALWGRPAPECVLAARTALLRILQRRSWIRAAGAHRRMVAGEHGPVSCAGRTETVWQVQCLSRRTCTAPYSGDGKFHYSLLCNDSASTPRPPRPRSTLRHRSKTATC